ncbi:hypothetical protein F2P56_000985 [Juglans regia]|uniref:Uncharacterized protein LOC108987966 n=2 Tax=Juglans regia TaxID=51240 RepID=A0A2I4EB18_JUGRE|nr:uncharacterized protein LOC108987966 [Juglans regia]KAF5480220.1 hypothetical protein F2P56_000985 [Juglans regia]
MEARQPLDFVSYAPFVPTRENLGREIFEELGFGEMGEEVAKKWTLEEERAFHEVVLSKPASLDKNFWDHLLAVFPSRTKKDLNRFDPLKVDSDNDEWLKSELEPLEEDEDSVVESPFDQAAAVYYQEDQIYFLEDIEVGEEVNDCEDGADIVSCRVGSDEEDEGDIDDISGTHVSNSIGDCRGDVDLELCGKISCSNGEDDVQDDSCTSYESQQDRVDTCGPPDARIDARESSEE